MYYLHWEPFRGCHASQWTKGEGATSQAITALKGSSPPAADPWRDAYVPGDAAPLQGRVHLDQFVVEPTALSKVVQRAALVDSVEPLVLLNEFAMEPTALSEVVQRTGSVDSVGSIVLGDNLAVGAAAARRAWR